MKKSEPNVKKRSVSNQKFDMSMRSESKVTPRFLIQDLANIRRGPICQGHKQGLQVFLHY